MNHPALFLLFEATCLGKKDVLQEILQANPALLDAQFDGHTPFLAACGCGHLELIDMFLKLGSKAIDMANPKGATPLFLAAQKGNEAVVRMLLDQGAATIDTPYSNGCTPLYIAAQNGFACVVEALLRGGSLALDTQRDNGATPLFAAAQNGHLDVVKMLLSAGTDALDTPTVDGATPLYVAAQEGHSQVIDMLLAAGSKAIDIPTREKATPLLIAAHQGHRETTAQLIALGATRDVVYDGKHLREWIKDIDIQRFFDSQAVLVEDQLLDYEYPFRARIQAAKLRLKESRVKYLSASPATTSLLNILLTSLEFEDLLRHECAARRVHRITMADLDFAFKVVVSSCF